MVLKEKSAERLALFLQLHLYIHPQRILLKSVSTNRSLAVCNRISTTYANLFSFQTA